MTERSEPDLPDSIRRVVQQYHRPPETPREEIWARIAAARRPDQPAADESPKVLPFRPARGRRLVVWGTGIAAVLLLAFGLGRRSAKAGLAGTAPTPSASAAAPSLALRLAAADHLARTETFLTMLRTDSLETTAFTAEARDLLVSTRLMMDSPASSDPKLRALLLDLEFVLVQLVQLDDAHRQEELELITDGMEQQQVLPRIRTAIPAGPTAT